MLLLTLVVLLVFIVWILEKLALTLEELRQERLLRQKAESNLKMFEMEVFPEVLQEALGNFQKGIRVRLMDLLDVTLLRVRMQRYFVEDQDLLDEEQEG